MNMNKFLVLVSVFMLLCATPGVRFALAEEGEHADMSMHETDAMDEDAYYDEEDENWDDMGLYEDEYSDDYGPEEDYTDGMEDPYAHDDETHTLPEVSPQQ